VFPKGPIRVIVDLPQKPRKDSVSVVPAWLKDAAPLVTGIGTLLFAVVSFIYVQGQELEKQRVAAARLRQEALAAVAEKDAAKQEVAAITMADYGESALPTLRVLLSGSDPLSSFGKLVVQKWMDGRAPAERARLLQELAAYARSRNNRLRLNAYSSLASIGKVLTAEEARGLLPLFMERFGSTPMWETDPYVARAACPLLNLPAFDYANIRTPLRHIAQSGPAVTDVARETYASVLTRSSPADACGILADVAGLPQAYDAVKEFARSKCKT